jgi:hypothetical protein
MTDSRISRALSELRKIQRELSEVIESLEGDESEIVYEDLYPLIVKELREHGSMLDYELIEKLQVVARRGRFGPETTVWQTIDQGLRHGKLVADREVVERTKKMKDRTATPNLKDRYYGYSISLPKK